MEIKSARAEVVCSPGVQSVWGGAYTLARLGWNEGNYLLW